MPGGLTCPPSSLGLCPHLCSGKERSAPPPARGTSVFCQPSRFILGSLEICPSKGRGSSGTLAALEDIHWA